MGHLTTEQLKRIDQFLDQHKLTFPPLRQEIMDHIISDLEQRMTAGQSFESSWQVISTEISPRQFQTLQNETMEAINRRFNISKALTYLSLALLTISTVFKLLHFPGTTLLVLSALGTTGLAIIVSSFSGISLYKEKRGSGLMIGTLTLVLLFMLSWLLMMLRLPGAIPLRILSIIALLFLFPVLMLYFRNQLNSEQNILTFLHEKHTPGIERFLLILLSLAAILKLSALTLSYVPNISSVLLIIAICAAALQYFALTWNPKMEKTNLIQALLILAFVVSLLPALGTQIDLPLRAIMATTFYIMGGFLALRLHGYHRNKLLLATAAIISIWYLIWMSFHNGWLPDSLLSGLFNLPVLAFILLALILSPKYSLVRTYMIMVAAHFLFEFPIEVGLL